MICVRKRIPQFYEKNIVIQLNNGTITPPVPLCIDKLYEEIFENSEEIPIVIHIYKCFILNVSIKKS